MRFHLLKDEWCEKKMKSGKAVYRNHLSLSRRFSYFKYEIHDEGEICVLKSVKDFLFWLQGHCTTEHTNETKPESFGASTKPSIFKNVFLKSGSRFGIYCSFFCNTDGGLILLLEVQWQRLNVYRCYYSGQVDFKIHVVVKWNVVRRRQC